MSSILVDYICPRHGTNVTIHNIQTGTTPSDCATKSYVDSKVLTQFFGSSTVSVTSDPSTGSSTFGAYAANGTSSGYISGTSNTLGADFFFTGSVGVDALHVSGLLDDHGGAAVAKKLNVGDTLTINNSANSMDLSVGSSGELALNSSGTIQVDATDALNLLSTTNSSSLSTGSFQDNGGAVVMKKLVVGGVLNSFSTDNAVSITTGAITTPGGISAVKQIRVGGDLITSGSAISPFMYSNTSSAYNAVTEQLKIVNSTNGAISSNITVNTDSNFVLSRGILLPTLGASNGSSLSYYESCTVGPFAVTGPWTTSKNMTLHIIRLGNVVTIEIAPMSASAVGGTSASIASTFGVIPSRFFTYNAWIGYFPIIVIDNSIDVAGVLKIDMIGKIEMFVDPLSTNAGKFSILNSAGWEKTAVTYVIYN
jgi:hypothetical protein